LPPPASARCDDPPLGEQCSITAEQQPVPATVEGTEHGDHLGLLRLDFGGDSERLRHVSREEWSATFDERELNFLCQQGAQGRQSQQRLPPGAPIREHS
jgi:hypothetical protein